MKWLILLILIPYFLIFGRFIIALFIGIWIKGLQACGLLKLDQNKVDAFLERICPEPED